MALSRKPPDKSTAKFFERLPPSFSLESRPKNLTFQFLDHSDPDRDKVVRKKAREWVNRNKEDAQKDQCQLRRKPKKRNPDSADSNNAIRLVEQATQQAQSLSLKKVTELRTFDAFNIFPGVQEDRYNILQYFLESPFMWDALPCCDDRHILDNDKTLALSTRDNSIMWNMARGEVSFVVWLYSIVLVRDGMRGLFDTEDARSWYNEALKKIRGELADQMQHGNFSDHLINALACIQATSSFAGMFEAAIIHHSAMTNILKMKGKGDILTGLKQLSTWSRKAIQWCEFFVSAEQVQLPDIPYYCVSEPNLLPRSLLAEAVALTQRSKENLPFFRGPLNTILYQLHQLGLVYAHAPKNMDIDRHAAGTLYDTEYALLQVLSSQRQAKDDILDVEILLAETLQLYLWVGPRRLRPQTRLCSLLASRVAMALAIFIPNSHEYDDSGSAEPSVTLSHSSSKDYFTRCRTRPRSVNNLIAWSLALSAVAGAAAPISEYQWLEANCALQIQAMGLDNDIDSYRSLLKLFPKVDGFDWIDLEGLHNKIRLSNKD